MILAILGDESFLMLPFCDLASENFKQVIVIPGNHEFYTGYDLGQLHDGWCFDIRPNVIEIDSNRRMFIKLLLRVISIIALSQYSIYCFFEKKEACH